MSLLPLLLLVLVGVVCVDQANSELGINVGVGVSGSLPGVTLCSSLLSNDWIHIMKRSDTSERFYRNWTEYKWGFGNGANFYIGNEKVHCLTALTGSTYSVRVEIQLKINQQSVTKEFYFFSVDSEENNYRMRLKGESPYCQDPNDSAITTTGFPFSTADRNNDLDSPVNCPVEFRGAWWFNGCKCPCPMCDYDGNGLYWFVNGAKAYDLSAINMWVKSNQPLILPL